MHNLRFYSLCKTMAAMGMAVIFASIGPYIYYTDLQQELREKNERPKREQPSNQNSRSRTAPDFAAIKEVKAKKAAFFDYLRPMVVIENQRIRNERAALLNMAQVEDGQRLTSEQQSYAKRLGKLYKVALENDQVTHSWLKEMLIRVNVLPEALVLSQAANESAWGTSRFAREGNNYFGQWCYSKGCGMVPLQRSAGSSHEVASFSSTQQSVHGYFMNINRNRAYKELRILRQDISKQNVDLESKHAAFLLTQGLLRYSERKEVYVGELQSMIRHNDVYWSK